MKTKALKVFVGFVLGLTVLSLIPLAFAAERVDGVEGVKTFEAKSLGFGKEKKFEAFEEKPEFYEVLKIELEEIEKSSKENKGSEKKKSSGKGRRAGKISVAEKEA
ncbi:MAG: hypothetical protein PHD41_02140 [Methanosarcinaceae archaeon]|nr:hypothetical protein [Methanosarcinaceae archaeon]MDD4332007.1 hypothetical protein [Methanosarcinaceae archaeon]